MKMHVLKFWSVVLLFTAASCKKSDDPAPVVIPSRGVFVINEGAFGNGNASLSQIDPATGVILNDLFENVNGYPLGDIAQSMYSYAGRGYVVVNNSQKVEVINAQTMQVIQTINGFQGPRYFVASGTKGYVSDWFSNSVAVVDLLSNAVVNSIPTGEGPEQMVIAGNRLFVANVGGWDSDSTVTVIDLNAEAPVHTLHTGVNPNSLCLDVHGKIWVLCGGSPGPDYLFGTADDIGGSLHRIDPATYAIEFTANFPATKHPVKLQRNGDGTTLYFLSGTDGYNGKIVQFNADATSIPLNSPINREFYGLGIDPKSGTVYGGYAPGFTVKGYVYRYAPSLTLMDSLKAGIAPNGFCFVQ